MAHILTCPNGHKPETFLVTLYRPEDPDPNVVQVYPDGTSSNRWEDGTVGVNREAQENAEAGRPYNAVAVEVHWTCSGRRE